MQISGTGITTFDVYVKNDFKPDTILALNWVQKADGNYAAVDRGAAVDLYRTDVRFYGTESTINNIITEIEANRNAGSNELTLSDFNAVDDRIFGADVDYGGSITAVILDYGERAQKTWKGFHLSMKLQAVTPSFLSPVLTLPSLKYQIGYIGGNIYTIDKVDSYNGVFSQFEHGSDTGLFSGVVEFNLEDHLVMRRYLTDSSTGRGNDITISSIPGIDYPFGPNRGTAPWTVKVIRWEDLGHVSLSRLQMKLTMAEVV